MTLRRYGRIDFVDDLVAASDLVVTKPGGLIVSEVLARATPLLIIDPIAGHEEWNADFVAGSGAGMQLRYPEGWPWRRATWWRTRPAGPDAPAGAAGRPAPRRP